MKELIKKASELIDAEYKKAIAEHGHANSTHEAWALLKEEIDEAETEFEKIDLCQELTWHGVRDDNYARIAVDAESAYRASIRLVAEAVQVGAMARKLLNVAETELIIEDIEARRAKHD